MFVFLYLRDSLKSIWEKREKEIDSLNGLRALSILAVLLYHFYLSIQHLLPNDFPTLFIFMSNLTSSVDLFFLLSGFLIYGILHNQWEREGGFSFKKFYINRSLRIFPAYYFYILISVILLKIQYKMFSKSPNVTVDQLSQIANLMGKWIYDAVYMSNYIPSANIHTWTLALEEQFYLFFPFLCYFILFKLSNKNRMITLLVLYFTVLLVRLLIFIFGFGGVVNHDLYEMYFYKPFHTRFDSIIAGVITYEIYKNWKDKFNLSSNLISWIILIIGGILVLYGNLIVRDFSIEFVVYRFSILGLGFGLLIIASIHNSFFNKVLSLRFFTLIARLSYGMYLWHFIAGIIALAQVGKLGMNSLTWLGFIKIFCIGVIFSLIFALFSYIFIEYPFLRFKDKINKPKLV